MGKRIASFLAAVPMTASLIVNTNIDQPKTNNTTNFSSAEQPALIVSAEIPEQITTVVVKEKKEKLPKKLAILDEKETRNSTIKEISTEKTVSQSQMEVMEKMVAGYPIAQMLPYIEKRDPVTAAFIIAIAKKESNWGKVSPKSKDGDCFNYFGFKDHRFPFVAGHSCFPSAEVAVEYVGNRIDKLIAGGKDTPAEMSVWKCGSACATDKGVGKWISDVSLYTKPILRSDK